MDIVHRAAGLPAHSCILLPSRDEALSFPTGSLALGVCRACGFVANCAHDESLQAYSDRYEETQGFSPTFRDFSRRLAADQVERHGLHGKHVIEIGCGKGEFLLDVCASSGGTGTGIDPSVIPDRVEGPAAGRTTWIAEYLDDRHLDLAGDAVMCRHTLEHIHHPARFLELVRKLASAGDDPAIFFEVPDVGRVLDEVAFWDVYYEHCSYFTPGSLARLFRRAGFEVTDLRLDFDDQYILLDARLARAEPGSAAALTTEEDPASVVAAAHRYGTELAASTQRWRNELRARRAAGGRTAVWGGGSKGVAFLTTLGVADEVSYVVDINPHKQGMYMAGTGHRVVGPAHLRDDPPDLVVVMNPIYVEEVRAEAARWGSHPDLMAV